MGGLGGQQRGGGSPARAPRMRYGITRCLPPERKSALFHPRQFHIKAELVKYDLLAGAVRLTDEFEVARCVAYGEH